MSASTSSSGTPAPYVCKLASFLKDYMNTMEQMPKEIQLVSSQIIELDKNSDMMLTELENITSASNFSDGWVPSDLRRRVTRILIDLQSISDEQHRLMSDVSENVQRHTHKIESERKEAEVQLRLAASKVQAGSSKQAHDAHDAGSASNRDISSVVASLVSTPQGGVTNTTKKKRMRDSVGTPTNAKHAKKSKEAIASPLVSSTPISGGSGSGASPAGVRRVAGGHRKNTGHVSNVKKEASERTSTSSTASAGGGIKKKKKNKSMSPAAATKEKNHDKHATDKSNQSSGPASSTSNSTGTTATTPSKPKTNRRRLAAQEKEGSTPTEAGSSTTGSSAPSRRRGDGGPSSGTHSAAEPSNAEDETRYCFCNRVSLGSMVACDGPRCEVEWFHFECVGLTEAPKGNWYCSQCEQNSARPPRRAKGNKSSGGGSGR